MIEPSHPTLSVTRQCEILGLARSTAYYQRLAIGEADLDLMDRIDRLYTDYPFYGSRQMVRALRRDGVEVNRKRVRRLMRQMGLEAQCPQPNTSKPTPGHTIYPYLMKSQTINQPQQAWCSDITYIRMEGGFVYLVAIMDWHSRQVLSWEISNTLDTTFCLKALRHALTLYGAPRMMNTDQGCQFTSEAWINELKDRGVQVSMDGRGRALDNVFVERLWRTVKYEEVYRREYESIADLRGHLATYFHFYNHIRPHSSHDGQTPAEVHSQLQMEVAS
jgi:putative transposase